MPGAMHRGPGSVRSELTNRPVRTMTVVTIGLKWAPLTGPKAKMIRGRITCMARKELVRHVDNF